MLSYLRTLKTKRVKIDEIFLDNFKLTFIQILIDL